MGSNTLHKDDYFSARGLHTAAPEGLNQALKEVLDSMTTTLYPTSSDELTESEQALPSSSLLIRQLDCYYFDQ